MTFHPPPRISSQGTNHDGSRESPANDWFYGIDELAGEWYRWFVAQHEDNPGRRRTIPAPLPGHPDAQHVTDDWMAGQGAVLDELEAAVGGPPLAIDWAAPEARREWQPILADRAKADQFLTSKGEVLTPAARDMFLDAVLSEFLIATSLLSRRAGRDYSEDQHLKTLPEYRRNNHSDGSGTADLAVTSKVSKAPTAMQLFEGYIAAVKSSEGTITTQRVVFTTLDRYLAGRSFDALSDEEAQRWITSLVTNERCEGTVKRTWIGSLKAVGRWAVKQPLIARNPFTDCEMRVPKKARHRETRAFRTDEILLILSACSAITHPRPPPGIAARRWVPWLCAYTGARGGEITQLRSQDVIERDGIKAILITPDAGPVKTRQARVVPLHEHLIAQGFWTYARAKGTGPLFYNAAEPEATDGRDITHPKRPRAVGVRSQLATWIRSIGIVDPEVSPNHGWRRTFLQIARRHMRWRSGGARNEG
jgi:integrase